VYSCWVCASLCFTFSGVIYVDMMYSDEYCDSSMFVMMLNTSDDFQIQFWINRYLVKAFKDC
jgi:hypothetical protein